MDFVGWFQLNNQELKEVILADLKAVSKPLDKDRYMEVVRERLKDYPKQLQEFGEWFEKHSAIVLNRINRE